MAEDFSHPSHILFLHPSENPNNVSMSILLHGRYYGYWKKAMKVTLIAKNKLTLCLGNVPNQRQLHLLHLCRTGVAK